MKILTVNKFFYRRGGSEAYYFNLNNLLENEGHELIHFSMKDDKNSESPYSSYFIQNINYDKMSLLKKLKNSIKIIYSVEARKNIERLIKDTGPDIAHLHNYYHQMSPSILYGIKKYGIPIVNTVHDYKPICPNYKMLNEKGICEDCRGGRYYKCYINKCVKDSRAASFVNVLEAYLHRYLETYDMVDTFICPSVFLKNKLMSFGIPQSKVVYIPNYVDINEYKPCYSDERYFVYSGRLSREKGLATLMKAMKKVKRGRLLVIGTGPYEDCMKELSKDSGRKNIRFCGYKTGDELKKLISLSRFVVLPSECYENCPMSLLEAMALGKPVLASRIGGIPELIDEYKTGLTFEPGNTDELAEKIDYLLDSSTNIYEMGKGARKKVEESFNQRLHYERIIDIYNKLLKL